MQSTHFWQRPAYWLVALLTLALALSPMATAKAATGDISTVAGNGTQGYAGDNSPATNALLNNPSGVAVDADGNLYIADLNNHRIRKVDGATGNITTVAGNGTPGYGGDGGLAINASLSSPYGVAVDGSGNVFIADTNNQRIRRVDNATGTIATVAGNGTLGSAGDGGLATSANLYNPADVIVDGNGNLFIADRQNNRIRRVDSATGIITTVAGNGSYGYAGDGGSATSASLSYPYRLALDGSGNLFIADYGSHRIRRVDATTGFITTVAGNGNYGFAGDGAPATSATLHYPTGVAVDGSGNVFIADTSNQRVRRVDAATGTITTVAGNGSSGYTGDNGPATSASLYEPRDVAVDGSGNIFIADDYNQRIRMVEGVAANAGGPYSGDEGSAIALDGSGSTADSTITQYEWDCESDGTYDVTAANPTGSSCTYADNGNFTVTLRVTDAQGQTDTDTADVVVNNVAPTATFGNDGPVDETSDFSLSLSNPTDPGADTFTYAFDCGDGNGYGSASATSTATCATTVPGVRAVKGKIIDDDGGETEYTGSVTVNDIPPALDIPDDLTGNQGQTVDVPVNLTSNFDQLSALNFTVGFDAACLSLDTTDGNSDGVPDSVVLNQTTGFQISANSSNAATGSLELVINAQANTPPLPTFSDGAVATVTFSIVCGDESTDLTLSNASFGNSQGASVSGQTDGGAVDINRPPVAVDDVSKTTPATAVTIDVLANDTDPDTDDSHTVASVTTPSNGATAIVNNEVVYTPNGGFLGLDSFDYTISDGNLTDTGTVQVAVGIRGDANADTAVDAGDLPAVVLEIFDNDGNGWLATGGSTFAGNPVGTDSNEDQIITAGDLSCTVRLLLFGVNDPCAADLRSGAKASLSLPGTLSVQDGAAQVAVSYAANGNQAAALALALEIDESQVAFDAADNNGDGLPDGLQINLGAGFQAVALYKAGVLNLVIFSPELKALPDGAVATLSLAVTGAGGDSPALRFSSSLPASAGGVDGATVPIQIDNDAVEGVDQPAQQRKLFLPAIGR